MARDETYNPDGLIITAAYHSLPLGHALDDFPRKLDARNVPSRNVPSRNVPYRNVPYRNVPSRNVRLPQHYELIHKISDNCFYLPLAELIQRHHAFH